MSSVLASRDGVFRDAQGMWASKDGAWVPVPLGGGAGSPGDIPGLGLWLEADSIMGLADGSPVVSWPDKSGQNRHAVPVGSGPVWRSAAFNGKHAVQFSGTTSTSTRLRVPGWGTALSGSTQYTLFTVIRQDTDTNSYPIITCAPTDAVWQWLTELNMPPGREMYWGHGNGKYRLFEANYAISAHRMFAYVFAPAASGGPRFFQNGIPVTEYALAGGGDMEMVVPALGADVLIGGHFDGQLGVNGLIPAMLWYDRALTNSEQAIVENYLLTKYGPFARVD